MSNIVMHVDVNSAFLSWTAAYEKQIGIDRDIRNLPAVIGGNEKNRHGIVLAKSIWYTNRNVAYGSKTTMS